MIDVLIGASGKTLVHEDGQTLFKYQGDPPPVSYLLNEDFEGTGTPSGWFGSGGNFDSTSSPLQGLQSLRTPNGSFAKTPDGLNQTELYFKFLVRFSALPASSSGFFQILDASFNPVVTGTIYSDGKLEVTVSGFPSSKTVNTVSAGVDYAIVLRGKKGTGANGIGSISFALSGNSVPTSGNSYTSISNAPNTVNMDFAFLLGTGGIPNTDFDVVQAAATLLT